MKKILKNLFYSIVSFFSLAFYLNTRYDFIISCLIFVLLYFFVKTDKEYNKREKKFSIIISILISLILSIGKIVSQFIWDKPIMTFDFRNIVICLIIFYGFYLIINRIFNLLFEVLPKIKLLEEKRNIKKRYIILIWVIILCCWLPYFIRFFPAIMSSDSYYVIHYANNFILSDLHTFGHTWFFGLFFHLGKFISNNLNIAVAFGSIAQMLLLSFMFVTVIKYLYKKGFNKYVCLIVLMFYALFPINAVYSVTLWRDVLFGGAFSVICVYLFEYTSNNYKLNILQVAWLLICIIIMLFFRNNGIYIFILMVPLITILSKQHKMKILFVGLAIVSSYFIVKGPIFNYFEIASTKSIEAYSIPLQQIARTVALNGNISENEKEYLEEIMQYENIKNSYKQVISDPIKNITDGNKISDNKFKFLYNWFTILLKNPQIYVESYLYQTIGYWYPNIDYGSAGSIWTVGKFEEEKNVKNIFENDNLVTKTIDFISSKRMPLSNFIWSIGTYFILLLICTTLIIYKKKYEYLIVYIPIWCLWGTIMISTPVFAELRYIYGLFTAMPILLCIPFFKNEN